ncbi:MAG TPA: type II toxin-antitoxin system VapC family toxin [Candidatus Methylacidiphilales bacterium]|jgi:predicted nucleic acid-binding protein|nr:type II toxin-antitoxin system VapC family toxin [Candidatus Methylacidiphilales bacterium]
MKPVCCDTSFLVSLYVRDAHNVAAHQLLSSLNGPLTLSLFNQFEFEQALRYMAWRNLLTAQDVAQCQAAFAVDCNLGRLVVVHSNVASILNEARRLSAKHTMSEGHRTLDILQVAAALHLGATDFLTFDAGQRKLARTEGLKVRP